MRRAASDIFDIGQKLTEVKQQLGHGSFMNWLKSEFNWSGSTATRFMQVSEQFKFVNLVNADIAASALYELAAPSTPLEARLEAIERALKGEPITYSQAKEIAKRYQELSQIEKSEPVTIDIDAEIVGAESSAAKQHQLQLFGKEVEPQLTPHLEASSSIQVSASEQTETMPSSALPKKDEHPLPHVKPNHSSLAANERPFSNFSPAKSISLNPGDICTLLVTNVEFLTNEQIETVWQALAHRLSEVTLGLANWSDVELQRLIANAEQELSFRQSSQFKQEKENLHQ